MGFVRFWIRRPLAMAGMAGLSAAYLGASLSACSPSAGSPIGSDTQSEGEGPGSGEDSVGDSDTNDADESSESESTDESSDSDDSGDSESDSTSESGDESETGGTEDGSDTGDDTEDTATSGSTDEDDPFFGKRIEYLHLLAEPIVECAGLDDTQHPAFDGCYDWHSHVHAIYALLVLHRLTGEQSYLDAALEVLVPADLARELEDVRADRLSGENPYGYAWFLLAAREYGRVMMDDRLVELAQEISVRLRSHILGLEGSRLDNAVMADGYGNVSWAALCLWRWATWSGSMGLVADMEGFARERLLDAKFDALCPLTKEASMTDNFFAPCLHRAMALLQILPVAETAAWIVDFAPANLALEPLISINAAHQSGLNFSRPFGLWSIYKRIDEPVYRDIFIDHMVTHLEQPQFWAEDYVNYSHWVPQFGVHAISLTFDAYLVHQRRSAPNRPADPLVASPAR